jgi:hypothetical protein
MRSKVMRGMVRGKGLGDGDVVFVGSWKKVMRYGDVNFWI